MSTQILSMETHCPGSHVRKPAHEQIAALAYQLHIGGGGQPGASLEDWLFAEYVLSELQAAAGEATIKDKAALYVPGVPAAKQEPSSEPPPLPVPCKTPRPVWQEPISFPLAAAVFGRHSIPESPGAHAFQSIDEPQPAMAGFEMATVHAECSDRWRGINE